MRSILSAEQIRAVDLATMAAEPISSTDLMERAARVFSTWFMERCPTDRPVWVLAGVGNNGGDGLAVARHLHEAGYTVSVGILWTAERGTVDFHINLERLERLHLHQVHLRTPLDRIPFSDKGAVIDALFGSGLNRPLDGMAEKLVRELNGLELPVYAIDIPSGMYADKQTEGIALKARACLSFEVPKRSLLLPDSENHCDAWECRSIGWDRKAESNQDSSTYWLEKGDLAAVLPVRKHFSHKGTHGRVLVAGGAHGMRGAAWLSAAGALRAGAGLVACQLTGGGPDYCPGYPEILNFEELPESWRHAVCVAGPGMGISDTAAERLRQLLTDKANSLVLDADALNLLARYPEWRDQLPEGTILTPHPAEFDRWYGPCRNPWERLDRLQEAAQKTKCVFLLKGAHTAIAAPDGRLFFNCSGNPGMATGGTGDVLSGVIGALRAQGLYPLQAAWAGVLWHGMAGDRAAASLGMAGMIASDLLNALPLIREDMRRNTSERVSGNGSATTHPFIPPQLIPRL